MTAREEFEKRRDDLAFKELVRAQSVLNPTQKEPEKYWREFLAYGNKSQTLDAHKSGYNAGIKDELVLELVRIAKSNCGCTTDDAQTVGWTCDICEAITAYEAAISD